MTKKSIICSFAALFFLVAMPALAYSSNEGDLVRAYGDSAIYYIDASGYRHLFPTGSIFSSWYPGYFGNQSILMISSSELNQLSLGKNVTIRPGFALMRFKNNLTMYAVLPGNKICRAPAYYGNSQYNRAIVIPSAYESDYSFDGICDIVSGQKLPDGTLLRYRNSDNIYYIQNGQRRWVTRDGFAANRFRFESVVVNIDSWMSYPDGSSITGREDALTKPFTETNYSCNTNWSCDSWSSCSSGYRYRTCRDMNYCNTLQNKPAERESCSTSCSENWSCTSWNVCQNNQQERFCLDTNRCGTTYNRPTLTQYCQQ